MRPLLVVVLLVVCVSSADASPPDTLAVAPADSSQRNQTVVFPVIGYTPDTGGLVGATLLRFFYLDKGEGARSSTISPVLIYTFKNQVLAFLGLDLNWGQGRWHATLTPGYQKFPDDFYGIGRDVPAEPLETYTPEQFGFNGLLERETIGELRVGVTYDVAKHQIIEAEPGGVMDSGLVPGSGRSVVSAPGLQLAWDTRDNTWVPRHGEFGQARVSLARGAFGSDYDWTEYTIDLRTYLPAGERGTWAGQLLYVTGDGDVPFHRMPRLGGFGGLRGYSGGRYLDRTLALVRAEWRSGEFLGRLGAAIFAGFGDVAPTPSRLTTAAQLYSVGGGLRFTLSRQEGVAIRMDYGVGNGDAGFFLSIGEAF